MPALKAPIRIAVPNAPPLLYQELPDDLRQGEMPFDQFTFLQDAATVIQLDPVQLLVAQFRGTSLDRLPVVMATGIDVVPADAVIYVNFLDKAWEYGGFPKLVLALKHDRLRTTFREVPVDTGAEELVELRKVYRTLLKSRDGRMLWLTRLPEGDRLIATPYETAYARWIPEHQFDSLLAAFVFARPKDEALESVRRLSTLTDQTPYGS